jgi:hypothetical protein
MYIYYIHIHILELKINEKIIGFILGYVDWSNVQWMYDIHMVWSLLSMNIIFKNKYVKIKLNINKYI